MGRASHTYRSITQLSAINWRSIGAALLIPLVLGARIERAAAHSDDEGQSHASILAPDISRAQISGIDDLATTEPYEAVKFYQRIRTKHKKTHPHLVAEVAAPLLKNSEVPAYFAKKLADVPHLYENATKRQIYFELLGDFREPWAVQLLASQLMSDEPLTTEIDDQQVLANHVIEIGTASNQAFAAWSLGRIGFNGAPGNGDLGKYSDELTEKWREWWTENEGNIDELLASAQTQTPQPPQNSTPPPHPKENLIGKAPPKETPTPPTETPDAEKPNTLLYVVLGLLVVAVAVVVLRKARNK